MESSTSSATDLRRNTRAYRGRALYGPAPRNHWPLLENVAPLFPHDSAVARLFLAYDRARSCRAAPLHPHEGEQQTDASDHHQDDPYGVDVEALGLDLDREGQDRTDRQQKQTCSETQLVTSTGIAPRIKESQHPCLGTDRSARSHRDSQLPQGRGEKPCETRPQPGSPAVLKKVIATSTGLAGGPAQLWTSMRYLPGARRSVLSVSPVRLPEAPLAMSPLQLPSGC